MDIEARIQNIITESAVVVKFMVLKNFELMVRRLQENIQYQALSFFASSCNAWWDVLLEEWIADEEDKSKEWRMTYRMYRWTVHM